MTIIKRKSIRISSITEALLKKLNPELAEHGAGYIVDCLAAELAGLPAPLPPDVRRQKGAERRGKELKDKPALNPAGRASSTETASVNNLPRARAK